MAMDNDVLKSCGEPKTNFNLLYDLLMIRITILRI